MLQKYKKIYFMYPGKYSPNPNFFSNINENFKLNDNYVSNTIIPSYNITNFYNYNNNRDLSTKNANESITNSNIQSSIDKNKQISETGKILNIILITTIIYFLIYFHFQFYLCLIYIISLIILIINVLKKNVKLIKKKRSGFLFLLKK